MSLSPVGFVISMKDAVRALGPIRKQFFDSLTVIYNPKVGPRIVTRLWQERMCAGALYYIFPRATCRMFAIKYHINVFFPLVPEIPRFASYAYDNQLTIVNYLRENVFTHDRCSNGTATAILNLRAGEGKTFTAGRLIGELGLRTLYVVPKSPLAVQTVSDLRVLTHGMGITVGRLGDRRKRSPPLNTHHITVAVINSAIAQPPAFFAQYALTILDEVHAYCTHSRSIIFRRCTRAVLGMSATTENRVDKMDPVAHRALASDGIIRAENIPGFAYEEIAFIREVRAIMYYGPPEYTETLRHESTGRVFCPYMTDQFMRDPYRMKLFTQELRILFDWRGPAGQQHRIYVFCSQLKPLRTAYDAIVAAFSADGIAAPELGAGANLFVGGISNDTINQTVSTARIILTTYGYSGTGVSIQDATAMIFLDGRREGMLQILARITRRGSDMTIPRVYVDIVDAGTALRGQYSSRKAAYMFYKATITRQIIHWNDITGGVNDDIDDTPDNAESDDQYDEDIEY